MTNEDVKGLALSLLQADTEREVIEILTKNGLWNDSGAWRLYGDRDGNFATIGNQQSRPEAALVEKIVNAVDARLMNECLVRAIDPASEAAPPTIRHAVARFFESRDVQGDVGGTIQDWPQNRQLDQSQNITIAVSGATARGGNACITIADCGEGQTPGRMPETFLSIDRDNKLRIPFVQGKFNMGGTGALKFCGEHGLQLIITRRNPELIDRIPHHDVTAGQWGFTIVRRERPTAGVGQIRHSVYKYLAPVGAPSKPSKGEVLSFDASELKVMPVNNRPWDRAIQWGSVVKLYEYDMKGFKSHALMKGGLLSRLELLLPGIALPVRVHECRAYRGDEARSFANSLVGLSARLAENRGDNLELGYPTSVPFTVRGEPMIAQIYAFKDGKADTYRTNEGIVFTINGQTHGAIPKTFFARSSVKMGRLASSLLVLVDCSRLSVGAREDLFMNSRDRLSNGELRKAIEDQLEELIGKHPGLRQLRDARRSEEIAERLEDSRPLEDVLDAILKSSPSLAKLFLLGQRLSRPHRAASDGASTTGGDGTGVGVGAYRGKQHPTFFRFHHKIDGEILGRNCEIGRRCRIKFETDVENEYFSRASTPGRYHVEIVEGSIEGADLNHSLTLHNGVANWSISFPEEQAAGEQLTLQCTVTDDTLTEPFVNIAQVRMIPPSVRAGGSGVRHEESGGDEPGSRGKSGPTDPAGITMPKIIKVRLNDMFWNRYKFDDRTACKIVEDGVGSEDDEQSVFTFYVNVDNVYLRTDMKGTEEDVAIKEAKYVYANVLVALALLHDRRNSGRTPRAEPGEGNGEEDVSTIVDTTTRALGPFLVPMIDYLGALSADEVAGLAAAGDDE